MALALVLAALLLSMSPFGFGQGVGGASPGSQGNQAAARQEATDIRKKVQVPPGSVRSPSEPSGTDAVLDPQLRPRPHTVVKRIAWWVMPLDSEGALEWLREHPPIGSQFRSRGGVSYRGGEALTVTYSWPADHQVLQTRKLQLALADAGESRSVLRATAEVEWTIPHPASAKVPTSARILDIEATDRGGRNRREHRLVAARQVQRIAQLINSLPVRQPRQITCPRVGQPPTVRLRFRVSDQGRSVATAEQQWPPGYCRYFRLRIEGHGQMPLSDGERLVRTIERMLSRR